MKLDFLFCFCLSFFFMLFDDDTADTLGPDPQNEIFSAYSQIKLVNFYIRTEKRAKYISRISLLRHNFHCYAVKAIILKLWALILDQVYQAYSGFLVPFICELPNNTYKGLSSPSESAEHHPKATAKATVTFLGCENAGFLMYANP